MAHTTVTVSVPVNWTTLRATLAERQDDAPEGTLVTREAVVMDAINLAIQGDTTFLADLFGA